MPRDGDSAPGGRFPYEAVCHLAAFAFILYALRIETDHLFFVTVVALGAFIVASLAPIPARQPIFLAASTVAGVLTIGIVPTAIVLGLSVLVVLLVNLKIPTLLKILGITVILAAILASRHLDLGIKYLPVIGAIFGFRAYMFLYDWTHDCDDVPLLQQLSYFVLLPNFAMPLFPLLDFRAFAKGHRDTPAQKDLRHGAWMCLMGVAHLIVYRVVYHYLQYTVTPDMSLVDRAGYVVGFWLLYLRVSGTFHIAIGLLHFFGYRLPPTHERFLLSKNFVEFWRRTNTYWKNFNQKFVFTPIASVVQRRMPVGGLQISVFLSLIISWAIHSYQVLFLTGSPLLVWRDMMFWFLLAVAMVASTTIDQAKPQKTSLKKVKPTPAQRVRDGVQTVLFFSLIAIIWSFWSADSWNDWATVMGMRP